MPLYSVELEKQYLEIIANVPSVKFDHFVPFPDWIRDVYHGTHSTNIVEKIGELAFLQVSVSERMNWLKSILSEQNIFGEWLFSFSNLPFACVYLPNTYDWVEPLWYQKVTCFDIVSLDEVYLLSISYTERCSSDNCYIAWTARRPVVKS